ncbi:MAG: hypothetical protein WC312_03805 [Candidatus Omnitrophota bacterium]|jgi:hypothetical protein
MRPFFDYKFQFHNVGAHGLDFEPSDEDTAGAVRYYGFLSYCGAWIIMAIDTTTPTAMTYRYYAGKSGYSVYWAGRADLPYVTYDQLSTLLD